MVSCQELSILPQSIISCQSLSVLSTFSLTCKIYLWYLTKSGYYCHNIISRHDFAMIFSQFSDIPNDPLFGGHLFGPNSGPKLLLLCLALVLLLLSICLGCCCCWVNFLTFCQIWKFNILGHFGHHSQFFISLAFYDLLNLKNFPLFGPFLNVQIANFIGI